MARKETSRKKPGREAKPSRPSQAIAADGEITQALGYENFRVSLDNGVDILANVSGKVRQNHIKIVAGDRVKVEISPYDLTRGRIVYRYNQKP